MARILVQGAGGPAGVNTIHALKVAGHQVFAWDQQPEHLVWAEQAGATPLGLDFFGMDLWLPQPDPLVRAAAMCNAPTFLPKLGTILVCQDKFEAGLDWRRAGLRDDPVTLVDDVEALLELEAPYWLRARHGAGAKAAILARSWSEAYHWFRFWREREPSIDMVAEGYLPGRDLSWASVWHEGELQAHFARERLEYLYPHLTPEGLTGTPTRARIVHDGAVDAVAEDAVRAVDRSPHGIFCVDLREDEDGVPRPTEINAGRFSTTVGLWSLYSDRSNLVAAAVDLALNGECEFDPLPEGLILSRHIDCGHQFTLDPVAVAA